MQNNRRVLAHYVVYQGRVFKNSILASNFSKGFIVEQFTHEVASTEFVSGVVAVCDEDINIDLIKRKFERRQSMFDFAQYLLPYSKTTNKQLVVLKFYSDGKMLILQDL